MNKHGFILARRATFFSDYRRQQVGCVVMIKNKVLAVGYNCDKTHPLQKEYNKFRINKFRGTHRLHAEIHALSQIKDMDIDWRKVEVYIYRETKAGRPALARPCNSCMQMMKSLGIRKIFYTTDDGYAHEYLTEKTIGKGHKETV